LFRVDDEHSSEFDEYEDEEDEVAEESEKEVDDDEESVREDFVDEDIILIGLLFPFLSKLICKRTSW
jgi:hypothetical protein